ncbi:MAG: hypothetical protein FWG68_10925 [Defluviitaleaceae bacterium]|nr:hypothetical protein [Defluviitaleaceae bacterium]
MATQLNYIFKFSTGERSAWRTGRSSAARQRHPVVWGERAEWLGANGRTATPPHGWGQTGGMVGGGRVGRPFPHSKLALFIPLFQLRKKQIFVQR